MPFKSHILQDALMRHTLDLPEQDYYKVPYQRPAKPGPGLVLLSRRPLSPIFKITWHGGQSITIMGDAPRLLERLDKFGLDHDLAEKALQHIWNFEFAYVRLRPGSPDSPPVTMPTSVLAGRTSPQAGARPLPNTSRA